MRFHPGKTDVEREQLVISSGVFGALRPFVVEAVAALQSAHAPEDYVELQRRLLHEFLRHQLTQEQTRERVTELKARRAELTRQDPRPVAAIRAASEEITTEETFDHVLGCALHALRCVGDGLAWKAVDYDRRAITVMGDARRVGRLADEVGLQTELAEMDRLWHDEGRFAVHNDMTNCLRQGDLTIPTRLVGARDVEIAEVKAGGRPRPAQAARLDDKLAFLRSGNRPPAEGCEQGAQILAAAPQLQTYLADLQVAIRAARRDGVADFTPHPCMTVTVADYRVLSEDDDRAESWTLGAPRSRGWDPSGPRVIQSLSFIRRLRERGNSFAFIAPLSIFPLEPEDVTDLILGQLDVCTTVSCDELEATFALAGLLTEVAGGDAAEKFFLRATDGANTVTLPTVIREQMLAELVNPRTVVAAIRHSLAATAMDPAAQPASHLVPYSSERKVWAATLDRPPPRRT